MKFSGYIYIFLTIAFTVYGQLVLKWRVNTLSFTLPDGLDSKLKALLSLVFDPFVLTGLAAGFLASIAWMAAMTKFELSAAYPFMALNFVIVMIIAIPLFGESLSIGKLVGTALIVAGTVLVGRA